MCPIQDHLGSGGAISHRPDEGTPQRTSRVTLLHTMQTCGPMCLGIAEDNAALARRARDQPSVSSCAIRARHNSCSAIAQACGWSFGGVRVSSW